MVQPYNSKQTFAISPNTEMRLYQNLAVMLLLGNI
jgi:hypothetical protein